MNRGHHPLVMGIEREKDMAERKRVNAGYEIRVSVPVGNKEFVLGVHQAAPEQFVTWECKDGTDYIWGHYTDSPLKALRDLCRRVTEEVEYLEMREQETEKRNQPEKGYPDAVESGNRQKKMFSKEER